MGCYKGRSDSMKRHHYIPQVYLRRFVNPQCKRELWQYSMQDGSAIASTPKAAGCADYYHSFQTATGRDDESIERSFHEQENNLPHLFESLRAHRDPDEKEWWTPFWMVALHMVRVPKFQDRFGAFMSEVYQHAFEISRHTPGFVAVCQQAGISPAAEFKVTAAQDAVLCLSLARFLDLTRYLNRMSWRFLCAPAGSHFFTTDAPVKLWAPPEDRGPFDAVGLLTSGCELTFPLTRSVCAVASHESRPPHLYLPVDGAAVSRINQRVISGAYHYVYGPTDNPEIRSYTSAIAIQRNSLATAQ